MLFLKNSGMPLDSENGTIRRGIIYILSAMEHMKKTMAKMKRPKLGIKWPIFQTFDDGGVW
jgi:hypothetical protein